MAERDESKTDAVVATSETPAATEKSESAEAAAASAGPSSKEMTSKDYYFDSYSHFGIHEEMLKDEVRTQSYMNSIKQNPHLFKDKIVLDVGCGTGILSMFAAQAGAKHVYGVDCSAIIEQATEIVRVNGLSDRVTLIRGKMEEIELPVDKVDIIISEWMGYFLFYESMLDTVLVARDRYLREGGLIFPDKARLFVAGIEDGDYKDEKIEWWSSVYGFDMSCIKELAMLEPLVDTVDEKAVCSDSAMMFECNIEKVTKPELAFSAPFEITFSRNDFCHAMVSWFDIDFDHCHKPVHFGTGPADAYTHWKQTVFYFNRTLTVSAGDTLKGTLKCTPNASNPRDLDITIDFNFSGATGDDSWSQEYRLR